ncbi:MAG: signal peptide peptidase SppA [Cellvibrionales bacterium]|nr:signal peptide peptidase SppA [Cellvibrionales bacterium]
MQNQSQEWQLLEKVVMASVQEQKKRRRWRIFFLFLTFIYLAVVISLYSADKEDLSSVTHSANHTAFIKITGPIMEGEAAEAAAINKGLRKAFKTDTAKAILLVINSPGGSPVQAGYVYDEIKRLRAKYPEKKVYAVVSDMAASAAYYIASAADEIYADKASLVGSIGVISASFGYTGAMEKVGVERRVFSSGENKAFLDPFQPLKSEEVDYWQGSLNVVYQQFIDQVKKGRGDRLVVDEYTFSGRVWPGEVALKKGLVDGLGSPTYVAREVVKVEKLMNYSVEVSPMAKFLKQLSASMAKEIHAAFTKPSMSL